jgi:type VI secretion system protein ImpI
LHDDVRSSSVRRDHTADGWRRVLARSSPRCGVESGRRPTIRNAGIRQIEHSSPAATCAYIDAFEFLLRSVYGKSGVSVMRGRVAHPAAHVSHVVMELILEVTGQEAGELGASGRLTFDEAGGTIGRASGSKACGGGTHWSLPDPMVSGMHATVTCSDGDFFIEDRHSTNGVFLNSSRVQAGRAYRLRQGDAIRIDPYTITVSIRGSSPAVMVDSLEQASPTSGELLGQFSIGGGATPARAEGRVLDELPVLHDHVPLPSPTPRNVTVPEPAAADAPIPRGYNPLESVYMRRAPEPRMPEPTPVSPQPVTTPVTPPARLDRAAEAQPAPAAGRAAPEVLRGDTSLRELFSAAGVQNVIVTPELARELGQILRIMAQGLVDVLKSRRDVKAEFDVKRTYIGLKKNNPFKHARDAEEALNVLFGPRQSAFLGPVEAVRDSFDDVRKHHVAMWAGMRAAFEAMLAEFRPDRLEEKFSRRATGAIVPLPAKLRYWDLYRDRFGDLVHGDPDEVFRRLFGDAFSEAYTAQLDGLKAQENDVER